MRCYRRGAAASPGRAARWPRLAPLVATAVLCGAAIAFSAPAADAAPVALPPTLAGESFTQTSGDYSFIGPQNCTGGSFASSGIASGPYSGTYTENGSFTTNARYGAYGAPATGAVTAYTSTFAIQASNGDSVSGTETFDLNAAVGSAPVYCNQRLLYRFNVGPVPLTYNAVITTPGGAYESAGTAAATLTGAGGPGPTPYVASFGDALTSDGLLWPTALSQCFALGWTSFPQFSNLGGCASFVAAQRPNG